MGAKSRKSSGMGTFLKIFIVPLLIIDLYAMLQLKRAARHWSLSIIPGSISETLTQLALIFGFNVFVILVLVLYIYRDVL